VLHASLSVLGKHPAHAPALSLEQWAEVSVVGEMIEEARARAVAKALEPLVMGLFGAGTKKAGRQ
jgi:hypothetical protein